MANPYKRKPYGAIGPEQRVMVDIDAAVVPVVLDALRYYSVQSAWDGEAAYVAGYPRIVSFEGDIMAGSSELLGAVQSLYRLIDATFNGKDYTMQGGEVYPPIPAFPDPEDFEAPGMRQQMLDLQGVVDAGWFGIGGKRATLADILSALRVGNGNTEAVIGGALDGILNAGGDVASIFNSVRGLLGDVVEGATDGGILGVLIASSIASAAVAGLQGAQLDAISAKLDQLTFDPNHPEGDWPTLGQMLFDSFVLRYENVNGQPLVGPLVYLQARQLGQPGDFPTTYDSIHNLLGKEATLQAILAALQGQSGGVDNSAVLASIDSQMALLRTMLTVNNAALQARVQASLDTLQELHDCICGPIDPDPEYPPDSGVCPVGPSTETWVFKDWYETIEPGIWSSVPTVLSGGGALGNVSTDGGGIGAASWYTNYDVSYCANIEGNPDINDDIRFYPTPGLVQPFAGQSFAGVWDWLTATTGEPEQIVRELIVTTADGARPDFVVYWHFDQVQ